MEVRKVSTMIAPITVPDQSEALKAEAEAVHPLALALKAYQIQSPEQRTLINEKLVEVKTRAKALEAERTSVTKPLNQVLRTVNGWFKPLSDALSQVEDACKGAIWRYDRALEAEQQKQLTAAAEAYQTGNAAEATQALSMIPDVPVSAGTSVGTRKVLRIVSPDMVPREYCSPDPVKLRAVPTGSPVPGCVWEEEANVRVRI